MRMSTKGGATPRDRRLDRGKVAIAALAALFLFATNAQANDVEFEVNQSLSFLKQTITLVGPALGGAAVGTPQYPGSDTVSFYGRMYVDIQDTTIQLLPGAMISAAGGAGGSGNPLFLAAPGAGGVPGLFSPFDYVYQEPSSATPGVNPDSNYGLAVAAIGLLAVQYNLRIDNGWIGAPSTPMPLAGVNFNLAGQALGLVNGRQAFISALGNDTDDVIGSPLAFFGTAGSDIGTWDGVTLTLPVHSSYSFVVTNDFGGISEFIDVEGVLVLTPVTVPEPATMTLFGLGVVGLLSYALRARKRKA